MGALGLVGRRVDFFQALIVMFFSLCSLNCMLGILVTVTQIVKHLRDDE